MCVCAHECVCVCACECEYVSVCVVLGSHGVPFCIWGSGQMHERKEGLGLGCGLGSLNGKDGQKLCAPC